MTFTGADILKVLAGTVLSALVAIGLAIWNHRKQEPKVRLGVTRVGHTTDDAPEWRSLEVTVYNERGIDVVVDEVAFVCDCDTRWEYIKPDRTSVRKERGPGIWENVFEAYEFPPLPLKGRTNLRFYFDHVEQWDKAAFLAKLDHLSVKLAHGATVEDRSETVRQVKADALAEMTKGTPVARA